MEKIRLAKEKQSNSEERGRSNSDINDLPDPLLCHILSFLQTKDSVRTSLLSKRWRNLWLQVPIFDLDSLQFYYDGFSFRRFVNRFLESDENLALYAFKLICSYEHVYDHDSVLESWIDALVRRGVRHLDFEVDSDDKKLACMPLSLYSCNTLVSLSLYRVFLCGSELASAVSLPCLKVMSLDRVRYDESSESDKSNLEILLAGCPVLEKLTLIRASFELLKIISVRSKSLKSLALWIEDYEIGLLGDDYAVEIDAPRLEHMSLCDHLSGSIVIHSIAPYASVDIDVNFDGEDQDDDDDDFNSKRTMICNFLTRISTVSRMEISDVTLQVIHDYSNLEQLPQFSNLTWLYASFDDLFWEMLPTFLGCCPNLHTLVLAFEFKIELCPTKLSSVPPCFVSSLKYVELASLDTSRASSQVELARYFLRNCAALKKLTLTESFDDDIINKIKRIPRKSRRCIIVTD